MLKRLNMALLCLLVLCPATEAGLLRAITRRVKGPFCVAVIVTKEALRREGIEHFEGTFSRHGVSGPVLSWLIRPFVFTEYVIKDTPFALHQTVVWLIEGEEQ